MEGFLACKGKKSIYVISIYAFLFFILGCNEKQAYKHPILPGLGGPALETEKTTASSDKNASKSEGENAQNADQGSSEPPVEDEEDSPSQGDGWETIAFTIRSDPLHPENELYLANWRLRLFGIDDEGRRNSSVYFGMTNRMGNVLIEVPSNLYSRALVVEAYNDVMPFAGCGDGEGQEPRDAPGLGACRVFEIFIPPFCHDQAVWFMSPFENAVWRYYRNAAGRHGEGWNPSQVDCQSWLSSLLDTVSSESVVDELLAIPETRHKTFRLEALLETYRGNQELLVPTRAPICMAEYRHNGGGMNDGRSVQLPFILGPFDEGREGVDFDPIEIGTNGIVSNICGIPLTGSLAVNSEVFAPEETNRLRDRDFIGVISHERNTVPDIDVSVFNTKLGNGRPVESDIYQDACALTSVIRFSNTDDEKKDIHALATGVTFENLFGDGLNTKVFLTSNGDTAVDDEDFWAIFFKVPATACEQQVLAVELLGHREGDFRDDLFMTFDPQTENLFLGLRADYELNTQEYNGQNAFLSYTLQTWDGSTHEGKKKLRDQFGACYVASDPWALQFFRLANTELEPRFTESCKAFCPLELALFAVHSQCFSNSRSNQRWQNAYAGFWSMNSIFGVTGNVIINPGWLGPNLDFEIYIQKFDEAVFKGPRTIRRTDNVGQMMVELPTVVEGDRVLIRAADDCCSDYDLVLPCVPEFTGFVRPPGVPYVPPPSAGPINQ